MGKNLEALPLKYAWQHLVAGKHGPSSPSTRLVLFILSLHMKKNGADCWPSALHIARRTNLSERAVREHVKLAVAEGWLSVTARAGIVNVYFPIIPEAVKAIVWKKPNHKIPVWLRQANGVDEHAAPTPAHAAGVGGSETPAPAAGVLPPAQSEPQAPAPGAPHPCTTVREPLHQVHPNSLENYVINNPETGRPTNGRTGQGVKRLTGKPERKPLSDEEMRTKIATARTMYPLGVGADVLAKASGVPVETVRRLQ